MRCDKALFPFAIPTAALSLFYMRFWDFRMWKAGFLWITRVKGWKTFRENWLFLSIFETFHKSIAS